MSFVQDRIRELQRKERENASKMEKRAIQNVSKVVDAIRYTEKWPFANTLGQVRTEDTITTSNVESSEAENASIFERNLLNLTSNDRQFTDSILKIIGNTQCIAYLNSSWDEFKKRLKKFKGKNVNSALLSTEMIAFLKVNGLINQLEDVYSSVGLQMDELELLNLTGKTISQLNENMDSMSETNQSSFGSFNDSDDTSTSAFQTNQSSFGSFNDSDDTTSSAFQTPSYVTPPTYPTPTPQKPILQIIRVLIGKEMQNRDITPIEIDSFCEEVFGKRMDLLNQAELEHLLSVVKSNALDNQSQGQSLEDRQRQIEKDGPSPVQYQAEARKHDKQSYIREIAEIIKTNGLSDAYIKEYATSASEFNRNPTDQYQQLTLKQLTEMKRVLKNAGKGEKGNGLKRGVAKSKAKGRKVFHGRGLTTTVSPKLYVNLEQLKAGMLQIQYRSTGKIAYKKEIPNAICQSAITNLLIGKYSENEYKKLNKEDKTFIDAYISNSKTVFDPIVTEKKHLEQKWAVFAGEISAGNDSPYLREQLKTVICRLRTIGAITENRKCRIIAELGV